MKALRILSILSIWGVVLASFVPAQVTQQQAAKQKSLRVFGEALRGHRSGVTSVGFSPDGKLVLTAGADGEVGQWSTSDGKSKQQIAAHVGYVHFASYYEGGAKIVSVGCDRTIAFFDSKSGAELGRIRDLPKKFDGLMQYLCWQVTPDGRHLLIEDPTYKAKAIVRVDLASRSLDEPLVLPGSSVQRFAMAPDGKHLALLERGEFFGYVLHLYDLDAKQTVARIEEVPFVDALFFSADGSKLFVLGDKAWTVWNGKTGEPIGDLQPVVTTARSSALSADGNKLFVGASVGGQLVAIDLATSKVLFSWANFANQVLSIASSPHEKTVVAGSYDGSLRFFSIADGREKFVTKGHGTAVGAVALSGNSMQMITGSHDGTVMLWDVKRAKETARYQHQAAIQLVGYNAKGQLYSVSEDLVLQIVDGASGKVQKTAEMAKVSPDAMEVIASPDGSQLIVSDYLEAGESATGKHHVWDLVTGELLQTHATKPVFNAYSLASDGKHMAVLLGDRLALWVLGGEEPEFVFAPQEYGYFGMAMLGLDAVVTGNSDGQLVLWRKGTAEAIKQVALSERGSLARRLYVSPDAKRIFVGIREAVVIYDAELNELARLTSMDAIPESFAVSRDGKVLLCGMADSTVLVWSLDKLLK